MVENGAHSTDIRDEEELKWGFWKNFYLALGKSRRAFVIFAISANAIGLNGSNTGITQHIAESRTICSGRSVASISLQNLVAANPLSLDLPTVIFSGPFGNAVIPEPRMVIVRVPLSGLATMNRKGEHFSYKNVFLDDLGIGLLLPATYQVKDKQCTGQLGCNLHPHRQRRCQSDHGQENKAI